MTPEYVKKRIEHIESIKGDDESAHSEEDKLHQDVLWAIANECCDAPVQCALLALQTKSIEFERWFA